MDISPADTSAIDSNQAIGRPDFWHWDIIKPETNLRVLFDEGFHGGDSARHDS
jgi:hypothetical protein